MCARARVCACVLCPHPCWKACPPPGSTVAQHPTPACSSRPPGTAAASRLSSAVQRCPSRLACGSTTNTAAGRVSASHTARIAHATAAVSPHKQHCLARAYIPARRCCHCRFGSRGRRYHPSLEGGRAGSAPAACLSQQPAMHNPESCPWAASTAHGGCGETLCAVDGPPPLGNRSAGPAHCRRARRQPAPHQVAHQVAHFPAPVRAGPARTPRRSDPPRRASWSRGR